MTKKLFGAAWADVLGPTITPPPEREAPQVYIDLGRPNGDKTVMVTMDFRNMETRALAMQVADFSKGRIELLHVDEAKQIEIPIKEIPFHQQRYPNRHERRRQKKLGKKNGV